MKKIEITTAQNVTIQHTLATPWERGLALLIDVSIMGATAVILFIVFSMISRGAPELLMYLIVLPLFFFYSLAFELFNHGRSPGKMALQLRVIRMDGKPAGFLEYLMRWTFRALDIYLSIGTVALVSAISSRYAQRTGDLFANTVVVSTGKADRIPLHRLLMIHERTVEQVFYPQAVKLSEETALLIKECLERFGRIKNGAHAEAVEMLSVKIQHDLKITKIEDHAAFLKQVLKDYVVLTR